MTIEEIKKALNSGKTGDTLLKEYEALIMKAQNEITAEKIKAEIKTENLANARRKLATAVASYAKELFGESDANVGDIVVMLKEFENDLNISNDIFKKVENKKDYPKEKKNEIKFDKITESDDAILEAFFELFK